MVVSGKMRSESPKARLPAPHPAARDQRQPRSKTADAPLPEGPRKRPFLLAPAHRWIVQPSSVNFSSISASALVSAVRRCGLDGQLRAESLPPKFQVPPKRCRLRSASSAWAAALSSFRGPCLCLRLLLFHGFTLPSPRDITQFYASPHKITPISRENRFPKPISAMTCRIWNALNFFVFHPSSQMHYNRIHTAERITDSTTGERFGF